MTILIFFNLLKMFECVDVCLCKKNEQEQGGKFNSKVWLAHEFATINMY